MPTLPGPRFKRFWGPGRSKGNQMRATKQTSLAKALIELNQFERRFDQIGKGYELRSSAAPEVSNGKMVYRQYLRLSGCMDWMEYAGGEPTGRHLKTEELPDTIENHGGR